MATIGEALDLGMRYLQAGQAGDAERLYRQVLVDAPDSASAHAGLGHALWMQEKAAEARDAFQAVLVLSPHDPGTHTNLGNAHRALGSFTEAERHHREAVRLDPKLTVAHNNLGAVLAAMGRCDEALPCFTTAIAQNPGFAQAFRNLAESLIELGRIDEAAAAARRAAELDPQDAAAFRDLAFCQLSLGQLDVAVASHRAAAAVEPDNAYGQSGLLYTLNFHPGHQPQAVSAEHRQWARRHADPLTARAAPHANDRTPTRRLRVGYVSAHFWDHAINFFVEPILASHHPAAVEIFCYSSGSKQDDANRRLRSYAHQWREIGELSDEAASELVRRDAIDVLVDLAGHIPGNRLLLFAHKPAPVQVSYLGYQNTTGMAAMDYRLTDAWSDPPGMTESLYSEALVRLPRSFFCYHPRSDAPPVSALPALTNGFVTFGSFNYFAKVTPEVLATWAKILHAVPNSRLMILPHTAGSLGPYLAGALAQHGIGRERWTLADRRPRRAYLELIRQVDIALDPFPFNGHTTTCDALWQGVPVVGLAGRTYAGRFGTSAQMSLGFMDLIAESPEQYVDIAARLAGDLDRMQSLRAELPRHMAASALLDDAGFTKNLEAAYRQMWVDWCTSRTGSASP